MPRINLLPWREAERKRKRQEFFLSIGAAIATAALVILVGRWQMNAAIEHQNARNQIISDEIAVLDKQIQEILGLEKQKERLLARMEIIETLQRSRPEIVHVFDEVVRVLPEGVYLTYLKQSGTRFEIRGVAQSSTRVSAFMRNIDQSVWLKEPDLEVVQVTAPKGRGDVPGPRSSEFTVTAKQGGMATEEEAGNAKAPAQRRAAR